jgi:hypothetical protein
MSYVHRESSSGTSCCFSDELPAEVSNLPRLFVVNARSLVKSNAVQLLQTD